MVKTNLASNYFCILFANLKNYYFYLKITEICDSLLYLTIRNFKLAVKFKIICEQHFYPLPLDVEYFWSLILNRIICPSCWIRFYSYFSPPRVLARNLGLGYYGLSQFAQTPKSKGYVKNIIFLFFLFYIRSLQLFFASTLGLFHRFWLKIALKSHELDTVEIFQY